MLLTEFETLTGIYPDVNLYRVIEHEYNEGDWNDKASFCHDYKCNVDRLATRLQMAANQRLIDMEEQHKRTVTSAANRAQELCKENGRLSAENNRLRSDLETTSNILRQTQADERRSAMFRVLERYVQEDVEPDTIGCNVYAFVDLLKEEETP